MPAALLLLLLSVDAWPCPTRCMPPSPLPPPPDPPAMPSHPVNPALLDPPLNSFMAQPCATWAPGAARGSVARGYRHSNGVRAGVWPGSGAYVGCCGNDCWQGPPAVPCPLHPPPPPPLSPPRMADASELHASSRVLASGGRLSVQLPGKCSSQREGVSKFAPAGASMQSAARTVLAALMLEEAFGARLYTGPM